MAHQGTGLIPEKGVSCLKEPDAGTGCHTTQFLTDMAKIDTSLNRKMIITEKGVITTPAICIAGSLYRCELRIAIAGLK
jgi:hypothetical protein